MLPLSPETRLKLADLSMKLLDAARAVDPEHAEKYDESAIADYGAKAMAEMQENEETL